jgi:hypothetical protein
MNKSEIINKVESLLKGKGFTQMDYVVSLQGPTLILAMTGQDKMTPELEKSIKKLNMLIL